MKGYYYKKYAIKEGEIVEIHRSPNLTKRAVIEVVESYRDIHNSEVDDPSQEIQVIAFRYHNKSSIISFSKGKIFKEKESHLKKKAIKE